MKRKLLVILMALTLALSFCSVSFAATSIEDGEGIAPTSTNVMIFGVDRISATKGDVYITITFSTTVNRYNVVVYLQKKVDGVWKIDSSNEDKILYNNGSNAHNFHFSHTYTGLERGATYRIMCVSKDYVGDNTYIATGYSDPF